MSNIQNNPIYHNEEITRGKSTICFIILRFNIFFEQISKSETIRHFKIPTSLVNLKIYKNRSTI